MKMLPKSPQIMPNPEITSFHSQNPSNIFAFSCPMLLQLYHQFEGVTRPQVQQLRKYCHSLGGAGATG